MGRATQYNTAVFDIVLRVHLQNPLSCITLTVPDIYSFKIAVERFIEPFEVGVVPYNEDPLSEKNGFTLEGQKLLDF